jgi:hypothetical protein
MNDVCFGFDSYRVSGGVKHLAIFLIAGASKDGHATLLFGRGRSRSGRSQKERSELSVPLVLPGFC